MDSPSSTRSAFEKRIDLRQDPRYKEFAKRIGFECVMIPTSEGEVYGYIKYIPIIGIGLLKIQRYRGSVDQKKLMEVIKQKRIFRTILEPINDPQLVKITTQNKDPFLPSKTRVIKVQSKHDDFSQNVKRILRKRDVDQGEASVDEFFTAWRKSSKIWTLNINALAALKDEFGDDCILWTERENGEIIGGILCLISGQWAYYFAAFVTTDGRKNNAGVLGVAGLLRELSIRKVVFLDFEGVFDDRFPRDSWKGFSEFKSRFGGETIELPGCFGRWF